MSTVTLTDDDNRKEVEIQQGDEIVLRLPENPTTGYRWHIDRANSILVQEGDSYVPVPPPDPEISFGRGGVREFRFRGTAPGTARLDLKLWQEWEGEGSVTERFGVGIRISG